MHIVKSPDQNSSFKVGNLPFVWMQNNQAAVSSLAHLLSVQNYIDLEVLRLLMQKLGLLPVLLQF